MKARIIEIFSSIQGEGLWVGRPQVFVRFHGCRLHCHYCDTPLTHHQITECRIESPPYSKKFEKRSLEFSADELTSVVGRFGIPSIAITGGEPLEQADFLVEWFENLKGFSDILLETSGVEVDALKKVLPYVSMVSLDIKIPSATGEDSHWETHERFIGAASSRPHYAKVVFDERMTDGEIERLMMTLNRFPALTAVFQPISPLPKRDLPKCVALFGIFAARFPRRVRLIPQVHKFLSIL